MSKAFDTVCARLTVIAQVFGRYSSVKASANCVANVMALCYSLIKGGFDMAKTATLNIRIEPETKTNAEQLFSQFGITISDAVTMFLHQSLMEGGLPFEVKQPRYNKETETAIQEARDIMAGKISAKSYSSISEMITDLDMNKD